MNTQRARRIVVGISIVGLISIAGAGIARGQFTQNRETIRIDTSSYSAGMKKAYRVFSNKCGECHTLDLSLKSNFSSVQWENVIKQMQARPSSHINDKEAKTILDFLAYDESHRKAAEKSTVSVAPAGDSIVVGRQFYSAQSCDTCHSIGGKGGSVGPALDEVGAKLSRAQLIAKLKGQPPSQIMPPLPPGTTEEQINDLADYLVTLKGSKK